MDELGEAEPVPLTSLLLALSRGAGGDHSAVLKRLESELRAIARSQLHSGRSDLPVTELVNVTYLKLFDRAPLDIRDRKHFFALAARAMRQILVDEARRKRRGGPARDLCSLTVSELPGGRALDTDVLDLEAALQELTKRSPRQAEIVELRYFAGLDITEVASLLATSTATVERDWRVARAWLAARISGAAGA